MIYSDCGTYAVDYFSHRGDIDLYENDGKGNYDFVGEYHFHFECNRVTGLKVIVKAKDEDVGKYATSALWFLESVIEDENKTIKS